MAFRTWSVNAYLTFSSAVGRIPLTDAVVMFKTIILSALYNLSDDQVEHQIRDRLSFMRFLGLGLEDRVHHPMPRQCGCTANS